MEFSCWTLLALEYSLPSNTPPKGCNFQGLVRFLFKLHNSTMPVATNKLPSSFNSLSSLTWLETDIWNLKLKHIYLNLGKANCCHQGCVRFFLCPLVFWVESTFYRLQWWIHYGISVESLNWPLSHTRRWDYVECFDSKGKE